jgi:hypothetical protein
MDTKDRATSSEDFQLLRFANAAGLDAMDVFERGPDGHLRVKPELKHLVVEHRTSKNKFTRRGLSALLYHSMEGHGEANYYPPEIVYTATGFHCFQGFFMAADGWVRDRLLTFIGSINAGTNTITADAGTPFTTADIGRWVQISSSLWPGNRGMRKILSLPGGTSPNAACVTDGYYEINEGPGATLFNGTTDGVSDIDQPGDTKVTWDESDGQYDSKIPNGTGVTTDGSWAAARCAGRRATLISSDTGNPLRRVSLTYVSSSPYRELEILIYAAAGTLVRAISADITDTITPKGSAALVQLLNGNFTISDEGKTLKISGAVNAVNNRQVTILNYVDPTHVYVEVTDFVRVPDVTFAPMVSETGVFMSTAEQDGVWSAALRSGNDKYIDDLPIKTVGLAEGVACGSGESANRVGIRSNIGTGPTFFGVSDRVYQHEGSTTHRYVTGETLGSVGTDGYFVNEGLPVDEVGGYEGYKAFDGNVRGEATLGYVDLGGTYRSLTGPNHTIARVWQLAKDLVGYRLTFPLNTNRLYCPDTWQVWYLDKAKAPGGLASNLDPSNHTHWTQCPTGGVQSAQSNTIYDAGQYGVAYTIAVPSGNCYGLKLYNANPLGGATYGMYIAEMYAWTNMGTVTITANVNDRLMVAIDDAGSVWRRFDIGTVSATNSVTNLVNAINKKVRGWGLEAVRSNHGFLWLRSTVAGKYSKCNIGQTTTPANPDYSPTNVPLGLTAEHGATPTQKVGVTIPFTKRICDAAAFIYRVNLSSDLPGAAG